MFTDTIAIKRFSELQKKYGFQTVFETGTHLGRGSLGAVEWCPTVCTVEINPEFRQKSIKNWLADGFTLVSHSGNPHNELLFQKGNSLIYSCIGTSPEVLSSWIASNRFIKPWCLYLDAHWPNTVVRQELQVMVDAGISDAVICFHDFLVPGKEDKLRCDEYEGTKLSYDYVKDLLHRINPNYRIEYNSESSTGIGIMYALP